jgi:hypothetical protein
MFSPEIIATRQPGERSLIDKILIPLTDIICPTLAGIFVTVILVVLAFRYFKPRSPDAGKPEGSNDEVGGEGGGEGESESP